MRRVGNLFTKLVVFLGELRDLRQQLLAGTAEMGWSTVMVFSRLRPHTRTTMLAQERRFAPAGLYRKGVSGGQGCYAFEILFQSLTGACHPPDNSGRRNSNLGRGPKLPPMSMEVRGPSSHARPNPECLECDSPPLRDRSNEAPVASRNGSRVVWNPSSAQHAEKAVRGNAVRCSPRACRA